MIADTGLRAEAMALSDAELDDEHIRLSLAVCDYMSLGGTAPRLLGRQHRAVAEVWEARRTPRGAQGVR